MSEQRSLKERSKRVALGVALVGSVCMALYNRHTSAEEVDTPTTTTTEFIMRDPDILGICRQEEAIDQVCAFAQARKEIRQHDDVMAGIWAYHVTEPELRTQLDQLELNQALQAHAAGNASMCSVWVSRILDPALYAQTPICE